MGSNYLRLPKTNEEMSFLIDNFQKKFGFPQVFGRVDETRIPIRQPTENPQDYFCYKMKYSLNCQGICDHKGCFLNVEINKLDLTLYCSRIIVKHLQKCRGDS